MMFAAIDIGSNAVRLLFCNVFENKGKPVFKKAELVRVPLRLGEDSFITGKISRLKYTRLIATMKAFRYLMDAYGVADYKACATSAMREASNAQEIIAGIKKETGIKVLMIDGKTEAELIYYNHEDEYLDRKGTYFFIDIGGGSTEISISCKNKKVASKSFDIGTVRLLKDRVSINKWDDFRQWIKENAKNYRPMTAVGTGGNINKLSRMAGVKKGMPISKGKLKRLEELLQAYSFEERIRVLGLKPDRADVIVPAAKILVTALKMAGIEKMIVPEIGLTDGMVHQLYENYRKKG